MDATESDFRPPARGRLLGWLVLAGVAAAGFIYLVVATAPSDAVRGTQSPAIGLRLLHAQLQPLTGEATSVSLVELRGKVSLINFWGTWCGPCIREFPELMAVTGALRSREDFHFYAVSCGQGEDADLEELREATERFIAARNVELDTYADQHGNTRRALGMLLQMPSFAYPTTVLLDRDARIRGLWIGYDPRYVSQMKQSIDELLEAGTPTGES